MLNILQTGDLHLGKFFYGVSLLSDQEVMLQQLIQELTSKRNTKFCYQALIITGDIYDRSIPPVEAIELFDTFLTNLHSELPDLKVFLISGNHDSASRLSFCSNFLNTQNIFIQTNPEKCDLPIIIQGTENEKLALYQIPFLNTGALTNESGTRLVNQEELVSEAVKRIQKTHTNNSSLENISPILNAHLFTLGGISSDSERVFIGNTELIPKEIFSFFEYTALGHLHKFQKVTDKCFYAGSPLSYSFDEANSQKYFLCLTFINEENKTILESTKQIPIIPLHKVTKMEGTFDSFYQVNEQDNIEYTNHKNDYIEITCTDSKLIENPALLLRTNFPNLLSIKQTILQKQNCSNVSNIKKQELLNNKKQLNILQVFESFVADVEGSTDFVEWKDSENEFEKCAKEFDKDNL